MDKKAFTLLELTIVVALIAILATVLIILLNPWQQIGKANDARRKAVLATLRKVLEDYYNDKGCYPKPSEICYDSQPESATRICSVGNLISQACHICGNESLSPSFSPYLTKLPCDPEHKKIQYLYEVQPKPGTRCDYVGDPTNPCPQWYRIYTKLSVQDDPVIKQLDCQGNACGVPPTYGNNYGVTSPNEKLSKINVFWCINKIGACNNCGSYSDCERNSFCQTIYAGQAACCASHIPKPAGCP